jgi:aromatic ring-cleaving dioxygenase
MTDNLRKEAEAIAKRMDVAHADMTTRRVAEQSMRAVAFRYVVRAVIASLRAVGHQAVQVLETPTYADRLHDPEHAAIR